MRAATSRKSLTRGTLALFLAILRNELLCLADFAVPCIVRTTKILVPWSTRSSRRHHREAQYPIELHQSVVPGDI